MAAGTCSGDLLFPSTDPETPPVESLADGGAACTDSRIGQPASAGVKRM